MISQRKVGEVGEKQTLLVDIKINCFKKISVPSSSQIPTVVSSGQMTRRGREKAQHTSMIPRFSLSRLTVAGQK